MGERGILFSAPMVRALLGGRKTQTRRFLTTACDEPPAFVRDGAITALDESDKPYRWPRTKAVGDRLYVREAWRADEQWDDCATSALNGSDATRYEADGAIISRLWGDPFTPGRYRHARFMPRWASRLTLIVTGARVQRLQEISRGDAMEEGCPFPNMAGGPSPRDWYADLWNDLHGPEAWSANPWVAAYSFTVHRGNIDQMSGVS